MTKAEIRSLIKNYLPKHDKTNKYHSEVIDATIERAFNQAFSDIFFKRPMELDNYTVELGGSGTAITVSTDANTAVEYSDLTVAYVPLPDKASGVRHVYTEETGGTGFFPMSGTEFDLMGRGVLSANVTNRIGYVVRPTRIEYYGMDATTKAAGVRVQVLQLFREYSDSDVVNMPFSRDVDLIQAVLTLLGVVPPVDLKDDNAEVKTENRQQ